MAHPGGVSSGLSAGPGCSPSPSRALGGSQSAPLPSSTEASQAIVCTGVSTPDPALGQMPGSGKGGCGDGLIICLFRVKFILSVACLTFF